MSGLSDYTAENLLNVIAGRVAFPALPALWMALFTTAPTGDSGLGAVEVTGGAYARQQVAGALSTNASAASGATVLHFSNVPAWIVAQMYAFDTTDATALAGGVALSSVITGSSGTVTLSQPTSAIVSNAANIVFSVFAAPSASSGAEPNTTPAAIQNNAAVTFVAATGNWGTPTSYGLYDASGAGNLWQWDYLGNNNWLPCTVSSAASAVFTATANGFSTGNSGVFTTKYGGTAPSLSTGSLAGILTITSTGADTFTLQTSGGTQVGTSSTGDGQFRAVVPQSIPSGVTASFAAGAIVITSA